jgi:hypothetical protein
MFGSVDLGTYIGFPGERGCLSDLAPCVLCGFPRSSSLPSLPSYRFTFSMVVRRYLGPRNRGMLGIDIDKRFTLMFGLAAVAGLAGDCAPIIVRRTYHGHGLSGA